jgi:hypothetical protein
MSRSYIPVELRQQVYDRAQGCCEYYLISEKVVFFVHQVDHVIAEKHGGLTDTTNLALACIICNKYKGSDIASIDVESDDVVRLYHPRRDNWYAHFSLSAAKIIPLTAIGRVTVNLLQFNRVERIAERELLIKAGLFNCNKEKL